MDADLAARLVEAGVDPSGITDPQEAWLRLFDQFGSRATLEASGIRHVRIPPRNPQINGKVERFNRTLLDEWAYVTVYTSEQERVDALADWIHTYNHPRNHTPIGGPPISRAILHIRTRKKAPWTNGVIERFFESLKYENGSTATTSATASSSPPTLRHSRRSTTRSDHTRRSAWPDPSTATRRPPNQTIPTPNLSQILDTGQSLQPPRSAVPRMAGQRGMFATRFIDLAEQVNVAMPLYTAVRISDHLNDRELPVFGTHR